MRHNSRNKLKYTKKNKLNIKNLKKTKRTKRCQRGSGKSSNKNQKITVNTLLKNRLSPNDGIVIDKDYLCNSSTEIANSLDKVKYITFDINNSECENKDKLIEISNQIAINKSIESISFNNINNIKDIENIAKALETNTHIKILNLKNNNLDMYINETNISGTSGTSLIFRALLKNNNNNITSIFISGYQICSECVNSIIEYLKSNPKLKNLSMNDTGISNEGIQKIMNALKKNTNLSVLHLDKQDYITEPCKQAIYRDPLRKNKQIYFVPEPKLLNTNTQTIEQACSSSNKNSTSNPNLKIKKRAAPPIPDSKKKVNTRVVYDLGKNGNNSAIYNIGSADSEEGIYQHLNTLPPTNNKHNKSVLSPYYSLGTAGNNTNSAKYHVYDVGTAIQ